MNYTLSMLLNWLKDRFDMHTEKENEQQVIQQITASAEFRGSSLWVLIFAIFIASLGLNVNSTAVIIGAMLISPIMGPIIGIGLAVGINDFDLLKRSAVNFAVATVFSVLTATIYFFISPLGEAQSELLARTSPTLYDVLIAFCGGAAGIVALCTKGKGNVIPGVAIATALMPPLCTAGYGLATGHFLYFLGAFYLFFINTVFISLATYLGVRMLKFHPHEFPLEEVARKSQRWMMGIVVVAMIPALFMTISIVRKSIFEHNLHKFITTELQQDGTQILSNEVDKKERVLSIVAVGKEINMQSRERAQSQMDRYGMKDYRLEIIQGTQSDSLLIVNSELRRQAANSENINRKLAEQEAKLRLTEQKLGEYLYYEELTGKLAGEMHALFPQVRSVSLQTTVEANTDSATTTQFVTAVVAMKTHLTETERHRLSEWLLVRSNADSLVLVVK